MAKKKNNTDDQLEKRRQLYVVKTFRTL